MALKAGLQPAELTAYTPENCSEKLKKLHAPHLNKLIGASALSKEKPCLKLKNTKNPPTGHKSHSGLFQLPLLW